VVRPADRKSGLSARTIAERLVVVEGKGGHHRVVPAAGRFFGELGGYLHDERMSALYH
jgi:hypothetical protein